VKCIKKDSLSESAESSFIDEVEIMKSLDHPHILKYVDFFQDTSYYYLCVEFAPGGELFERIVVRESYSEDVARKCIRNVCLALKCLHNNNIVHR
jgi:serine/threonine protein kinase